MQFMHLMMSRWKAIPYFWFSSLAYFHLSQRTGPLCSLAKIYYTRMSEPPLIYPCKQYLCCHPFGLAEHQANALMHFKKNVIDFYSF